MSILNPLRRLKRLVSNAAARGRRYEELERLYSGTFFGPIAYQTDGIATSQFPGYQDDPRFVRALNAAKQCGQLAGDWRVAIYAWLADLACRKPGDLVECGVATGAYARAAIEYVGLQGTTKTFHLMDTFDGLVSALVTPEELEAGIARYMTQYRDAFDTVRANFAGLNVNIIKGPIPDTLAQCPAQEVCFLSIDMNCVAPEIAALEHFWGRMVSEGVIVLDDYGFPMHRHQRVAFDAFARRVGRNILPLPTGQAVLVK